MNGKHVFMYLLCIMVSLLSLVVLVVFIALWHYAAIIAEIILVVFLAILVTFTVVGLMGMLNEQKLRRERVEYLREIPLDQDGMPLYIPNHMQQYPSRSSYQEQTQQSYYGGYSHE
jgi:hypothetical protein